MKYRNYKTHNNLRFPLPLRIERFIVSGILWNCSEFGDLCPFCISSKSLSEELKHNSREDSGHFTAQTIRRNEKKSDKKFYKRSVKSAGDNNGATYELDIGNIMAKKRTYDAFLRSYSEKMPEFLKSMLKKIASDKGIRWNSYEENDTPDPC